MSTVKLHHFLLTASDGLLLPAFLYRAPRKAHRLVVIVHGAGSSSIVRRPDSAARFAETFLKHSIDVVTFNNRGAGYITKFDKTDGTTYVGGMTYEQIADFHKDITGIFAWAEENRYESVYLIGFSTGANKLALEFSKYTWPLARGLCLAGGGDDVTLQRSAFTKEQLSVLEQRLAQAKKRHNERALIPETLYGAHPLSWGSFDELVSRGSPYDIFPFGDENVATRTTAFSQIKKISLPLFFLYGSEDKGTIIEPRQALEMVLACSAQAKGAIIENAGHDFRGQEEVFARSVYEWIESLE